MAPTRPEASYERLLLDAMVGDSTLFIREGDEVENGVANRRFHTQRVVDGTLTNREFYSAGTGSRGLG